MDKDAWLAGLYEGEGSISTLIPKGRHSPIVQMTVNMTDLDVIERFHAWAECGRTYGPYDRGAGRKLMYVWSTGKIDEIRHLLKRIEPFLLERRRDQAARVIRTYEEGVAAATTTAKERLMSRVSLEGSCWTWRGTLGGTNRDKPLYAARLEPEWDGFVRQTLWRHHVGDLPSYANLNPTCGNPLCVNPEHLVNGGRVKDIDYEFDSSINKGTCWEWTGPMMKDRPIFNVNKSRDYAYRYSYRRYVDPNFAGRLTQTCGNHLCVKPEHLRPGRRSSR